MPLYEFYCDRCNTIYTFFSKRVNTDANPFCPSCSTVPLRRQMSLFATISSHGRDSEDMADELSSLDEAKMERAMELLAREAEHIDEDDPRQAARLMRKLAESTGMGLNDELEEALSRLEGGEDPERVEEEMGDVLSDENLFLPGNRSRKGGRKRSRPRVDEKLYDLE